MQSTGAAALATFVPRTARAQNSAKVVVIGAGLAGLETALLLEEQGVDVQVVEGSMRAGGRMKSLTDVPGIPEVGANSFTKGYARLMDAAERYGAELKNNGQSYLKGVEIVIDDKVVPISEWPDHPKNPLPKEYKHETPWAYNQRFILENNKLKQPGDWLDPEYAQYDISYDDWMLNEGQSSEVIDLVCNQKWEWNNSTHDSSALDVMFAYAWGSTIFNIDAVNTAYIFKGGNQRLPEIMAGLLKREVHYGKEVIAIRSESDGAQVHCTDGTIYRADRVVSSMGFTILRRIKVEPYFRGVQRKAIWSIPRQWATQVHLVPKAPFWKEDGFHPGMHISDAPISYVMANFGGDDPNELTSMMALMTGNKAERADQMDEESVKAMVVDTIEKIRPAAKGKLEAAAYHSWFKEPFAAGDTTNFGPGQVTRFAGKMNEPHERIHLCGDVTAMSANGMEGTLESAERVAVEILDLV
jgi:monoamine oxidase